ncbi:hypothetical protein [Pseudobacillus wudalianchiensis]|uniref:hypothetical protein n=1 Tax=Pseudobacillus wudalianchiensis TaxID=1743143 RepID=UPI00159F25E6|nr:hypothetical protein [Bacillus wudalianchiensis]
MTMILHEPIGYNSIPWGNVIKAFHLAKFAISVIKEIPTMKKEQLALQDKSVQTK